MFFALLDSTPEKIKATGLPNERWIFCLSIYKL